MLFCFNIFPENQPPQFSPYTPHTLHGIINTSLRIKIIAEDREGQNITFTLLKNGTISLSLASITKSGYLVAKLVRKTGTLFIQAEDAMGAKNVLILRVNATECKCGRNGTCVKNPAILYPVQPSDYYCNCQRPFFGKLCENRPNPCEDKPCYPGLECSLAQNSEGFTCEDCPPLFKGDGKRCELDTNQGWLALFCRIDGTAVNKSIQISIRVYR